MIIRIFEQKCNQWAWNVPSGSIMMHSTQLKFSSVMIPYQVWVLLKFSYHLGFLNALQDRVLGLDFPNRRDFIFWCLLLQRWWWEWFYVRNFSPWLHPHCHSPTCLSGCTTRCHSISCNRYIWACPHVRAQKAAPTSIMISCRIHQLHENVNS